MNIKQTITATAAILLMASTASAQGLLGKLKDKAVKAGQKKVEQVVTQKAEKAVEGAVTQTTDEQTVTSDSPARTMTEEAGIAADAVSYDVPNPYTYFDVPTDHHKVALGLPKNDTGEKPAAVKTPLKTSYAAYTISTPDKTTAKVFWNADLRRQYRVSSYKDSRGEHISRTLFIVDSLAFYIIDPDAKTITKTDMKAAQAAFDVDVVERTENIHKVDVVSEAGRWCYMEQKYRKDEIEHGIFNGSEEMLEETDFDLETGIAIRSGRVNGDMTHYRNIHVGLYYPELYELPKGYKWIVRDFSGFINTSQQDGQRQKEGYDELQKRAEKEGWNQKSETLEDALKKLGKAGNAGKK